LVLKVFPQFLVSAKRHDTTFKTKEEYPIWSGRTVAGHSVLKNSSDEEALAMAFLLLPHHKHCPTNAAAAAAILTKMRQN